MADFILNLKLNVLKLHYTKSIYDKSWAYLCDTQNIFISLVKYN